MNSATLSTPAATPDLTIFPAKVRALFSLKGQIATLETMKDCKVRKGKAPIVKHSIFQARIGVTYDNISAVKVKRADGTLPEENAGLPWGTWVEGLFPYVIEHKGCYYFRCSITNNSHSVCKQRFLRHGNEITVDEAKVDCLASEFSDHSDNDIFNIKIDNIISINGNSI